jgi:eukaryotic-like serine/threonine-protein kinase
VDSTENRPGEELTQIGKYDVVSVLGRGGMGVVYRCIDRHLGREVAVKTLTEGIKGDPGMLARFYDEGRKTGSFKHPNIVTVYELGDANGIPFIVMELVEGDPLDKLIRADDPLPMVERLRIVEELCFALGYAHRHNVIHRDVKPANIFVQPDGRVKLLDFGIARLEEKKSQDLSLTRPGHIIGTVPYMAPERLRDKPLDGRSDIFAAGVVLYQLVSGQLPFSGEEFVLMQRILNEPYPPLSSRAKGCPASLDLIIDRSLAKSPEDRYSTAEEMATDLTAAIAEIRQEQAKQLLPEAKRLLEAQDLPRARALLQQLLKVQGNNTEARELLTEIQKQLSQRQREEKIQQIRQQAEGLLDNKEFDKSLSVIDEGLEMDSANAELTKLRQRVEKEQEKQEQIREFLREADTARREGDYQLAIAATRKALQLDQSNSKGMVLFNLLTKEAEAAEKHAEVKALLQSARGELSARRYKEAIDLLHKAELLDPTNPELQLLLGDANSGLEQIKRRELVARLESQVLSAANLEQLQQVAAKIQEAMAAMPSESVLIRLNTQVDRQIREQENRRFVDDTIQSCRDLRPREALTLVQKARQRVPGDERLQDLERLLSERVRQQSVEERRDEYLSQARTALNGGRYADAVHTLEDCLEEGIAADEISSLLEFARHEEAEHRHQSLLRDKIAQAETLIGESAFDEAIEFLEKATEEQDDQALRLLLEQATTGRDSLRKQVESGLASAGKLVRAGKQAKAVEVLQGQSPIVRRSFRVQAAEAALKEEQQQAVFRMLGRAYTSLETDLPAGDNTIRRVVAALGDSAFAGPAAKNFRARMQVIADRLVADWMGKYQVLVRNRDKAGAGELAKRIAEVIAFASPQAQTNWQGAQKHTGKTGILDRIRK